MDTQVVIAGAGPVGLFLAGELRLAGISVLVLDPLAERSPQSKGLIIHPRTVEVLASRGLDEAFLAEGITMPSGHFASLPDRLDYRALDTDFPFVLSVLQTRTEKLLWDNASRLGVELRRQHRVTGFDERAHEITVAIEGPDGPYEVRADFLVGCDGANSTVRTAAGIDYPGTASSVLNWLGDVSLDNPPDVVPHTAFNKKGHVMVVRMPGGVFHHERHPIGESILELTRAQTAVGSDYSADGLQLRALLSSLIGTVPELNFELAQRMSGLGTHYPSADPHAHSLTGWRAPNLGGIVFDALGSGRYVLLDVLGSLGDLEHPWLITRSGPFGELPSAWTGVEAALIRPDGYVAWAGRAGDARAAADATRSATR